MISYYYKILKIKLDSTLTLLVQLSKGVLQALVTRLANKNYHPNQQAINPPSTPESDLRIRVYKPSSYLNKGHY